jgi:diguanylate cyclase (GGDEF)-like protein
MHPLNQYLNSKMKPAKVGYCTKLLTLAGLSVVVQWGVLGAWFVTGHVVKEPMSSFLTVSFVGLLVTALTIIALANLLKPIRMVVKFLEQYEKDGRITDLPQDYPDEVGDMMRRTRNTVLRLDQSMKETKVATETDPLTGIYNRGAATSRLHQDFSRSNRHQVPLSMIVVDLDDFKHINEAYGANVGDACLRHFADVAAKSIREGDWVGRWGGDEFVIALWGADSEIAEAVIWRIKRNLAASELALEAGLKLTASYGLATHHPGQLDYETINQAEVAIRNAKKMGRNRVCSEPILR